MRLNVYMVYTKLLSKITLADRLGISRKELVAVRDEGNKGFLRMWMGAII